MVEHPLACPAWQPALAGWVTAQLDPQEEAALVAHLDECAVCRTEAESLIEVAAVSLGADLGPPLAAMSVSPPADLGDRIARRVARERRARRVGGAAAAALAAVAAVVALALVLRDGDARLRGEEVVFSRRAPGVEAQAVVAAESGGSLVELTASGLDPDVTYALWLTPPGGGYAERVPAGTFTPDADGDVDVRLRSALSPEDMGRVWATTPDGDIALDTQ